MDRYVKKIPLEESVLAGNYFGFNLKKEAMDSRLYKEFIEVPFEDTSAVILKDYDTYLRNLYGDYMTPPPVEKQIGHHYNRGFDLHMGYEEYMRKHHI